MKGFDTMLELKKRLFKALDDIWCEITFDNEGMEIFNNLWDELMEAIVKENLSKINEIIDKFYLEFQKTKYDISWEILDQLEDMDFTDI